MTTNAYKCPLCGQPTLHIWYGPDGETASAHCRGDCDGIMRRIEAEPKSVEEFVLLIGGER